MIPPTGFVRLPACSELLGPKIYGSTKLYTLVWEPSWNLGDNKGWPQHHFQAGKYMIFPFSHKSKTNYQPWKAWKSCRKNRPLDFFLRLLKEFFFLKSFQPKFNFQSNFQWECWFMKISWVILHSFAKLMACLLFTQIGIAQHVVQDEEGWAHQKTFLKECKAVIKFDKGRKLQKNYL